MTAQKGRTSLFQGERIRSFPDKRSKEREKDFTEYENGWGNIP